MRWIKKEERSPVPDALQRETLRRRAGTHLSRLWAPALQRVTGVLRCVGGTRPHPNRSAAQ